MSQPPHRYVGSEKAGTAIPAIAEEHPVPAEPATELSLTTQLHNRLLKATREEKSAATVSSAERKSFF